MSELQHRVTAGAVYFVHPFDGTTMEVVINTGDRHGPTFRWPLSLDDATWLRDALQAALPVDEPQAVPHE